MSGMLEEFNDTSNTTSASRSQRSLARAHARFVPEADINGTAGLLQTIRQAGLAGEKVKKYAPVASLAGNWHQRFSLIHKGKRDTAGDCFLITSRYILSYLKFSVDQVSLWPALQYGSN